MADDDQVTGRRPLDDMLKICFPCLGNGTRKGAEKYCHECKTFFCTNCIDQHNVLFRSHRISDTGSADIPDQCQQHGKVKELYCQEDKTAGCDICISSEHGDCEKVVYLPIKIAQKVIKESKIDEIKTKVKETIQQLDSVEISQQITLAGIEADRDRCLQEINEHHNELSTLLEKIVKSSKDKVQQTFERLYTNIQHDHQDVKQCLDDLESSDQILEHGSDSQVFMEIDKHENLMKASDVALSRSRENLIVTGCDVVVDQRIRDLLGEIESLATIHMKGKKPNKVRRRSRVNISCKDDTSCCVYGTCVLYDHSIVLADCDNSVLKRLDQNSLQLIDSCKLQANPCDVCCIDKHTVAVTQLNHKIVLLSVNPRLSATRTIKLNHKCDYLAYSEGELFITDEAKTIYVYNTEGTLLRKITTDQTGQELFSSLCHIAVSDTGDKLYVADEDKGLITLDRQGVVQDTLMIKDKIPDMFAVCLDGFGGLFIGGQSSNNVVHVGPDGKILADVMTAIDGLVNPLSVCYDKVNKKLFVTQHNSNEMHICEFE